MRSVLLILAKDLRQRARDRSVLYVGLLVPLGLAAVFSLTFGDIGDQPFVPRYGLVLADDGAVAEGLAAVLTSLDDDGVIELARPADAATARTQVDDGELDGALVVAQGFSQAVLTGATPDIGVVGSVGSPLASAVAQSIAERFAAEIARRQLAVATTAAVADEAVDAAVVAGAVDTVARPFDLTTGEVSAAQLDQTTYLAAGMAVFFLFFTVQFGVLSLLEERQNGTLPRLHAAPLAHWVVPAAKTLTSAVLGIASLTTLLVATTVLLGADWGAPAGVALLVLAAVVAATSITAAVGTAASTPEQANIAQSVIAVLLGALGGVFFDVSQGSVLLERLSLLTPHQWFLRGLGAIRADGATGAVIPSAALIAFAGVGLLLTVALSRRTARS